MILMFQAYPKKSMQVEAHRILDCFITPTPVFYSCLTKQNKSIVNNLQ